MQPKKLRLSGRQLMPPLSFRFHDDRKAYALRDIFSMSCQS
jgi:hypothetical protein